MGGGGHLSFAKYTLNLPYIYPIFSSKTILFSYIILVKSGLTPRLQIKIKSLLFYIHFFLYILIRYLIFWFTEKRKVISSWHPRTVLRMDRINLLNLRSKVLAKIWKFKRKTTWQLVQLVIAPCLVKQMYHSWG